MGQNYEVIMNNKVLKIGHSPDPDDAFMFYGIASGNVKIDDYKIEHVLEDIQSLNQRAIRGELEITAISAHAYPIVSEKYWIMRTGASMGECYGPVLISKNYKSVEELKGKRVATPGALTTATLLFKIFTEDIYNIDIPFDQIMERINNGEFDAGVIIHEGQLTFRNLGFHKIIDFGEYWNNFTSGLPLPLGLDVIRKDLGKELAYKISKALKESIEFGYNNLDAAINYSLKFGRGLDRNLGEKFVKMYVSQLTIDMGENGKSALELLYKLAYERGLISNIPNIELI